MIIWINGAFGAGKTSAAQELHRRIPGSYMFDPENAGYYIRENLPAAMIKDDFQDHRLWREINNSMLHEIALNFPGVVIAPMTITDPGYYHEIIGRLREQAVTVHTITLYVPREMLLERLIARGEEVDCWPARQIDRCLAGFEHELFLPRLYTEKLTIPQVAEAIAALINIDLLPTDT
ncbi:AAA family ATPase [Paenibacillus tengchongensis]|uniref:AAA family ATPase n=1 Tax=Paenibacillus tengchongensis TaxID=2608684 RepID=UPI00124F67E5|nr:AAA family ATPase [Paenibacillus tengchongensis]